MNIEERRKIVQKTALDVLKDIIDFCEKHNIEYFMIFGSLLGAVRHKGMIPWDDDIDIAMTRKNCLKFIQCVKSDDGEFLQHNEMIVNGSGSTEYVSELKIGRRGTKYCPKIGADLKINSQITVDIFCVDYLKPSYVKHINRNFQVRRFLSIMKLNWDEKRFLMRVFKQENSSFKHLRIYALYLMHILRWVLTEKGIERIIYKMSVDPTKSSEYQGIVMTVESPCFFNTVYKLIKVDFEDMKVYIPSNYDEILSRSYGDYMTPPPEDKRYGLDKFEIVLEVNEI